MTPGVSSKRASHGADDDGSGCDPDDRTACRGIDARAHERRVRHRALGSGGGVSTRWWPSGRQLRPAAPCSQSRPTQSASRCRRSGVSTRRGCVERTRRRGSVRRTAERKDAARSFWVLAAQAFQLSRGRPDGWVRHLTVVCGISGVGGQDVQPQVGTRVLEEVLLAPARQHQRAHPSGGHDVRVQAGQDRPLMPRRPDRRSVATDQSRPP